ncbi:hypothetical protein MAQ5080_02515 [Marinomonas aquimarina]|uniref:Uncharacterized protein n=1 Tax=Marinomonas aquimarina TaxID=295068 RepID=A0A1A8TKJ8_9GAMM|nr:hypothetical protein [Marinomonas aquimarina]SBS33210.1 hypothetical protein MAQ5080_02515 [Marinomonas aquimarina]
MKMTSKGLTKVVVGSLIASQLAACGTLIYPERRGQTGGKLDIGVVALDALGLLFWFVPGVIAFGVDFITGAIYLPGGTVAQLSAEDMERLKLPDGQLDQEALKSWLVDNEYLQAEQVEGQQFMTQVYQTPEALQRAVNMSSTERYASLSTLN